MKCCVHFYDVQRLLELTLTGIWGRGFVLQSSPEQALVRVSLDKLYLPAVFYGQCLKNAKNTFISAAIHAAAHQIYSSPFADSALNNRQKVLISLIEDARVEYLADFRYPGVASVFKKNFDREILHPVTFKEWAYLIAKSLLFNESVSGHFIVQKACDLFSALTPEELLDQASSRKIGLALANDFGQMRIGMNEKETFSLLDYRDDNSFLWLSVDEVLQESQQGSSEARQGEGGVDFQEDESGRSVSYFVEGAEQSNHLVFNADKGNSALSTHDVPESLAEFVYPEWHYQIARFRQNWCTLQERRLVQKASDEPVNPEIFNHKGRVEQIVNLINAYQYDSHRKKRQEEGGDICLDAMINYRIESKVKGHSLPRFYLESQKQGVQDFSVLVLLDLSVSMNDLLSGGESTLLDITKSAMLLLGEVLQRVNYPYAVCGFNSNGRHECDFFDIKGFDDHFNSLADSLGGITAENSTRLGVALRHSLSKMAQIKQRNRLILLITDGEPSDVDVHDRNYLSEDAKCAVNEIEASGCKTFCLSLDSGADRYVQKIFRKNQYEIIDNPAKLTDAMIQLFLKVFRTL